MILEGHGAHRDPGRVWTVAVPAIEFFEFPRRALAGFACMLASPLLPAEDGTQVQFVIKFQPRFVTGSEGRGDQSVADRGEVLQFPTLACRVGFRRACGEKRLQQHDELTPLFKVKEGVIRDFLLSAGKLRDLHLVFRP